VNGFALAILALLTAGCASGDDRTEIVVQRFFGECGACTAQHRRRRSETECGILTTLINKFEADNPDVRLKVNVVAWPGYAQLAAQIAAGDPPDLVTMHQSVISDYQGRGLLEPMDGVLRQAGIAPSAFTAAARAGVVKDGQGYGLPWDTIGRLFHVNTKLMAQAGLMQAGKPVLPNSPEELLQHARQFKQRTGKPYLIQAHVNAPDFHVALLYTYLLAQNAVVFPDDRHIRINTPEAQRIVALFRQIREEGLTTLIRIFPRPRPASSRARAACSRWAPGCSGLTLRKPRTPKARSTTATPWSLSAAMGRTGLVRGRARLGHAAGETTEEERAAIAAYSASSPSTITIGRARDSCPRSRPWSTRRSSGPCRTAPTSPRSRRPASSCQTTSSARARSRG
jgi:hypothetical protein